MSLFTRSLWPDNVGHPYLRLAVAMVAAPLVIAAVMTLIAWVIAGSSETTRAGTMALTREAAVLFLTAAGIFGVLAGIPGVATLWALGKRSIIAWMATGSGLGAVLSILLSTLQTGQATPAAITVGVIFCWLMFTLIRAIAGVRAG